MPRIAKKIALTDKQRKTLRQIAASRTQNRNYVDRANIILLCETMSDIAIGRELNIIELTARKWRKRWHKQEAKLTAVDREESGIAYTRKLLEILSDAPRSGAPCKFTAEQVCQITSISCERPEDSGLPISHWSLNSLLSEVIKRGVVKTISRARLGVFLKSGEYQTAQGKGVAAHTD